MAAGDRKWRQRQNVTARIATCINANRGTSPFIGESSLFTLLSTYFFSRMPKSEKATVLRHALKKTRKEKNGLRRKLLKELNSSRKQIYNRNDGHALQLEGRHQETEPVQEESFTEKLSRWLSSFTTRSATNQSANGHSEAEVATRDFVSQLKELEKEKKRQTAKAQKEKKRLATKVAELEAQLNERDELCEQYEVEASHMKSENQYLLNEQGKLREQLLLQSTECQKLRSQIKLCAQKRDKYEAKASCMKSENQDLLTELSNLKEQSQLQSNEIQKLRSEIELKTQSWEQEKQSLLKDVTSERRVSVDHFERFPNCKTWNELPSTVHSQDDPPSPLNGSVSSSPRMEYGTSWKDFADIDRNTSIQVPRQLEHEQLVYQPENYKQLLN